MTQWWLVHSVGDADLGVSSDRDNADRKRQQEQRSGVLHETTDPAVLRARLVRLSWEGPTTGELSPLAVATSAVPINDPVRLVLVATEHTQTIAEALRAALSRAPDAFDRKLSITVVQVEGSVGLAEDEVATALTLCLQEADENDRVLITWGSGSTQLALGSVEAAIRARRPWLFINVGSPLPAQRFVLLNPSDGLDVDPLVPFVRRWRYHDLLADLIKERKVNVSKELRQAVLAEREHWQQAHECPTADNLRGLMTDALMRGDATSGFAVRAYVLAQYQQLRKQEKQSPLDLIAWAQHELHSKAQLGDMLKLIRQEKTDHAVSRSKKTASGQWLISKTVGILNEAGGRASHQLAPPPAKLRRSLREHLATVSANQSPVADQTTLLPAMGAWYVAIVGKGATQPKNSHNPTERYHPIQVIAEKGADQEIASYLGFVNPEDVDLRYLVLGTQEGSVAEATELAHLVNASATSEVAVADTVPDPPARHPTAPGPPATPPFDTEAAYALLRKHFPQVRADVGALVLMPTGPKPLVLPLLLAGLRLAAQEGIPLFLRQLVGPRTMHLLPVHFGTDYLMLGLARHALDILELDVAVRLLDTSSAGHELATRTDHLRRALRCDNPKPGAPWPAELPREWSRQDRSTGLAAQRVQIWAELAETHPEPAHQVRAVMGAYAVLERSIRSAQPKQPDEKVLSKAAWKAFLQQLDRRARKKNPHAQVLRALLQVRNDLPISHGADEPQDLAVLIARALRSQPPVSAAGLLRLVSNALQAELGDAPAHPGAPSLSAVLSQLRADLRTAEDSERARLARTQAGILRTQTDLIDLLGTAAIDAVAPDTETLSEPGTEVDSNTR